jgi:dolichol-phosphate mannosyltransferase
MVRQREHEEPSIELEGAVRPLLSLVVCTLDEADSIGAVLCEIGQALDLLSYEIIVVDDSEDDRTADIVLRLAGADDRVRLLRRRGERGLASAAITGWEAATGQVLAIIDGDGQHDPHLLPEMVVRLHETGSDIIVASRYASHGPSGLTGRRHLVSRAGTLLTYITLGIRSTDPLSGYFAMTRDWFQHAGPQLSGVGFKILVDIMASGRRRPKVVELSTSLRARHGGKSKLDARIIVELAALILEKWTRGLVPARFSLFAVVGSSGVAVHLGVLAFVMTSAETSFWIAQAVATFAAMTTNFFLNNGLTFRDRRLSGRALWSGLMAFYLSCAVGALLSEAVGSLANQGGVHWLVAGISGAFAAALWNFAAANRAIWREHKARTPATRHASALAGLEPAIGLELGAPTGEAQLQAREVPPQRPA